MSLAIESYAKPFARLLRADSLMDSVGPGRRAAAPLERHVRCCVCFERCQLSGVLCARWRLAACSHASYLGGNTKANVGRGQSRRLLWRLPWRFPTRGDLCCVNTALFLRSTSPASSYSRIPLPDPLRRRFCSRSTIGRTCYSQHRYARIAASRTSGERLFPIETHERTATPLNASFR